MSGSGGAAGERLVVNPFLPPAGPDRGAPRRTFRIGLPSPPAEGWAALALLLAMGFIVGLSIDDARWVLGRGGLTDYLPWAVALGIGWSWIAATAGWSRWVSHGLGAVFAALILPLLVGSSLVEAGNVSLHDWYTGTASSVIQAYLDLAVRGRALTQQFGHFVLILGLIGWATGQFAGYAAFGHRRPMTAVVTLGMGLLINMSITIQDQLPYLVFFSLTALLYLIRVNAVHEESDWLRRRLGDPKPVGSLYIRGGVAFVVVAVAGSLILTAGASSAPLAGAWSGVDQALVNFGTQLQRYLPGGGPGTRITGLAFGSNAPITGRWVTDTSPAFQVTLPKGDPGDYYWRAVAYDQFDNSGWSWTRQGAEDRAPSTDILGTTLEGAGLAPAVRQVTVAIQPLGFRGTTVFSPNSPLKVDQPTRITLIGGQFFGGLDLAAGVRGYHVTALVPKTANEDPAGLTENRLRAASTDYPPEISNFYLDVPAGATGPDMRALKAKIDTLSVSGKAYDIARAAEAYLRSSAFTYSTDVTDVNCAERSIAECFAHFRRGYCEYYATTMAILMRMEGIPARYVKGFLSSPPDPATNTEVVRSSSSHAWVEVYFPGYGWFTFDPTGGGVGRVTKLPTGAVETSASPSPSGPIASGDRDVLDPLPAPGGDITPDPNSGISTPNAPLGIFALLLLIIGAAAVIFVRRRSRDRSVQADAVYQSIARLASRLGFAPRPTETVYEYTGALADAMPGVRPELSLVADAKVEVAYGRRSLGQDRLTALGEAQRRLRVALLRLLFRRRRGR